MNTEFKKLEDSLNISVSIYCIGFSIDHDAVLLNNLAQSGTKRGNFVYIDTSQEDTL